VRKGHPPGENPSRTSQSLQERQRNQVHLLRFRHHPGRLFRCRRRRRAHSAADNRRRCSGSHSLLRGETHERRGCALPGHRYRGKPRKYGTRWSHTTVREIIRQRTYTGTHMVEINGGTGSIEHRVPAVVDPAVRQRPLAARGKQALRWRAGPSQLPPLGTHRVPGIAVGHTGELPCPPPASASTTTLAGGGGPATISKRTPVRTWPRSGWRGSFGKTLEAF
jgi:hypothetical protein